IETVIMPPYEAIAEKFDAALKNLREVAPTHHSVDDFPSEVEDAQFVQAFRRLMRTINVLQSFTDFNWDDLTITEQEYEDYKSKYLDIADRVRRESAKHKTSILEDIDF